MVVSIPRRILAKMLTNFSEVLATMWQNTESMCFVQKAANNFWNFYKRLLNASLNCCQTAFDKFVIFAKGLPI